MEYPGIADPYKDVHPIVSALSEFTLNVLTYKIY